MTNQALQDWYAESFPTTDEEWMFSALGMDMLYWCEDTEEERDGQEIGSRKIQHREDHYFFIPYHCSRSE